MRDSVRSLAARGIEPIGAEGLPISVHTEHRVISASVLPKVRQEPLFETLGGPGLEPLFSGNEAAPQLPNLRKAAPQPTAQQPTQPNRAGLGPAASTIGENHDGDSGAGRGISDLGDADIKRAIRQCVRSNPNQDELLQA